MGAPEPRWARPPPKLRGYARVPIGDFAVPCS